MLVPRGKNESETLEVVALTDPCYIHGILSSKAGAEKQILLQTEASRLIGVFDRKKYKCRCCGRGCDRTATRCTVYKSDVFNPKWWCDTCDPYQYGAGEGRIKIVRTYQDALDFAEPFGDPEVAEDLVRVLAEAKGLLWPPAKTRADIFFNGYGAVSYTHLTLPTILRV